MWMKSWTVEVVEINIKHIAKALISLIISLTHMLGRSTGAVSTSVCLIDRSLQLSAVALN